MCQTIWQRRSHEYRRMSTEFIPWPSTTVAKGEALAACSVSFTNHLVSQEPSSGRASQVSGQPVPASVVITLSQRSERSYDFAVLRPLVIPAGLCHAANRNNFQVIGVDGCCQHLACASFNAHNPRISHLLFCQCKQRPLHTVAAYLKSRVLHR